MIAMFAKQHCRPRVYRKRFMDSSIGSPIGCDKGFRDVIYWLAIFHCQIARGKSTPRGPPRSHVCVELKDSDVITPLPLSPVSDAIAVT
jgi:hypothetical protein